MIQVGRLIPYINRSIRVYPKSSYPSPFQSQKVSSELYFHLEEISRLLFQGNSSWDDILPNSRSLFPFNKDFSTSEQSLRCSFPQTPFMHWQNEMQAPVCCCCRVLLLADGTESLKGFTSLSCVNNGEVIPASRVSVSSDADGHVVEVGIETVSPWRKVDRRVLTGDLDQVLGLVTCERTVHPFGQTSHRRRGSMQGIPDSVSSPSGNVERRWDRPRKFTTRFEMERLWSKRTVFNTRHTGWLDSSSLEPMQVHWMKREMRNNWEKYTCVLRPVRSSVFILIFPSWRTFYPGSKAFRGLGEDAHNYMTDPYKFLWGIFCTLCVLSFQKKTASPGVFPYRRFSPVHSVSALLEQERTIAPVVHDYSRNSNCKSLLLNTVHLAFHW